MPVSDLIPVDELRDGLPQDPTQAANFLRMLKRQRRARVDARDTIHTTASAEGRSELKASESRTFQRYTDEIRTIDDLIEDVDDLAGRSDNADRLARRLDPDAASRDVVSAGRVSLGREERIYRPGGEHSLVRDLWASKVHQDSGAGERLARHQQQEAELEKRDTSTSTFGALVPTLYLTDAVAEKVRSGRPFANAVRQLSLPTTGMDFKIPKVTTGTSTAVQASQNSAVSETDIDMSTDISVSVVTIAGQQDISRQAFERGINVDELVFADLAADYAANLDTSILADDGTSGTHKGVLNVSGINSVTYTDTAPTVVDIWPKLADAIQKVASNRYAGPTVIFMHPRRWGWFQAGLDADNRPLLDGSSSATNVMGIRDRVGYGQVVGALQGVPVVTDANIPTDLGSGSDEDRIIVAAADDILLWEENAGMPKTLSLDGPLDSSALTVRLVAYGYSAFTAARQPSGISVISGTGLVAPSF